MNLSIGFTYIIIAGVMVNLTGKAFYFFTHPFGSGAEQLKIHNLVVSLAMVLFFYGLTYRLEPKSARRVMLALAVAALLRSISYLVNRLLPNLSVLQLALYSSAVAAEISVLYFWSIHLREMRSA